MISRGLVPKHKGGQRVPEGRDWCVSASGRPRFTSGSAVTWALASQPENKRVVLKAQNRSQFAILWLQNQDDLH